MPSDLVDSRAHTSHSHSPHGESRRHPHGRHRHRSRSRSPHRDERHRHTHRRSRSRSTRRPVSLPFRARTLSKSDFAEYKRIFATYLDIHKQLDLEDLDERELKGRWKSFVGKWNRGDLDKGWYDPATLQKANQTSRTRNPSTTQQDRSLKRERDGTHAESFEVPPAADDSQSDGDEFAPALPRQLSMRKTGPAIPGVDDLTLRDELREEDRALGIEDIRYKRKRDRNTQKERLEELVPRADPGSRERQLEKKKETTSKLGDFRDAKEGGDVDVPEADLLGDDGIEGYKKRKQDFERKKTEREIMKEERLRAKAAEREARLAGYKAKEDQTMKYFKAIAKERFG